VGGDGWVEDQTGMVPLNMPIRRSTVAGQGRPLLCGGVEHNITELAKTGAVSKEEEPMQDAENQIDEGGGSFLRKGEAGSTGDGDPPN